MNGPREHLVHTEPGALAESTPSPVRDSSIERGARSSAGERLLHTQDVAGSIPAVPTVDHIAAMLADDDWRMDVESRFWPKVMRALDWVSCWDWKGATSSTRRLQNYGSFKIKSRVNVRAHRISYALYHGRSPGELLVMHSCDRPCCVNPMHLSLGTVQDNTDDMMRKGRHVTVDQRGENNGAAKLSARQIENIRDKIRAGMTNTAIAGQYGVTHQLISRIRRGRAWGQEPMQAKYASLKAG